MTQYEAIARHTLGTIDTGRGLPSNQIHKLARDQLGRLWLAGPAGLSCFDGNTVHAYDRRHGLRCGGLRSVAISGQGTVWIGTDMGLEAFSESGHPLPSVEMREWHFGLCEHIDASGAVIWIGAAQGLVRIKPATPTTGVQVAFHADIGFVRHIARIHDSHIFAASDTYGLVEINGPLWQRMRNPDLAERRVTRVALGQSGTLLVGTDLGIFVLDPVTSETIAHVRGSAAEQVVTALGVGQHAWWVAFGPILLSFPFDSPENGPIESYLLESRINDLLVDALGNVWVATDTSGLALVSCLRHAIQCIDIGKQGAVFSIKPKATDTYHIGGDRLFGVTTQLDDQNETSLSAPVGLPATTIWDSHVTTSGVWAATHAGLYRALPGKKFVHVFAKHDVLGAPTRVLLQRGDELWIGTLSGLARLRDEIPKEVLPADGKSLGYVYALYEDQELRLWVATLGRGLWREDGDLKQLSGGPLSTSGNTYAVATGPAGETIVLQDERVILLDRNLSAQLIEECYPIAGWTLLWLDARTVAIGGSNGIRLLDLTSKSVTMSICPLLSARDWEFTNNRTLVRDSRGRLLCGVNRGLVRVDLELLRKFLTLPIPRLLDIVWHGVTPEKIKTEYRLRPGRWSFFVRVFCAWFVDHEQVRYRFKLVGFDDEWSPLRSQPEISYTSLPAGYYEMLVQAHSPLTGFGPPVTLCSITVIVHWWALGWTTALVALESFRERLILSRARNRRLLDRNAALEREIAERTSILFIANQELQQAHAKLEHLSQTDSLTQLANRLHFDQRLAAEIEYAQKQQTYLTLLLIDVDQFKAVNDQLGHQMGDDYLRTIAAVIKTNIRAGIDTAARYGGEEFALLLVGVDLEQASLLGERIRAVVAALALYNAASPFGYVTISIGGATMLPQTMMTDREFIVRADRALYAAKNRGRNQVVVSAGELDWQ